MKHTFVLPETPQCRVIYTRPGSDTQYGAMMRTPASLEDLRVAMVSRNVATKDIVKIEAVTPLAPVRRGHPAAHQLTRYATAAEH